MTPRASRLILLALAAAGLCGTQALAATFDFNSDGQFASNFHSYAVPNGTFEQSASSGNLTWTTKGGQTGAFVYDTNGSNAGVTNLLPGVGNSVVVEFDFSSTVNNVGVGIFFGGPRTAERLALFNLNNNGANDQLRIFNAADWNATTPATAGDTSSPTSNETLTSGGWTTNTTYHAKFTITYTSATTVDVSYVITDPSRSLTPFSISATGLVVSENANEIGFRIGSGSTAAVITLDNLSVSMTTIPEPSSYALAGGVGVLGLAFIQRRKRE